MHGPNTFQFRPVEIGAVQITIMIKKRNLRGRELEPLTSSMSNQSEDIAQTIAKAGSLEYYI